MRLTAALPELVRWWEGLAPGDAPLALDNIEPGDLLPGEERVLPRDWDPDTMKRVEDALLLYLVLRIRAWGLALRSLAGVLSIGPLLLLLGMTWYPFQPQQLTVTLAWTLILTALLIVLYVYVQVDRNEFVSKVARTTPNATTLDWTSASSLLTYLVPAMTVFLVAFPGVSYWLRSVLGPLSRALR